MKLWNCYAMLSIWGELESGSSYGIFSSREKAVEKITKEYRIGQSYNDGDYDYHWIISCADCYEASGGKIFQEELVLVNTAADDQETVCFVITEEEVDKGV